MRSLLISVVLCFFSFAQMSWAMPIFMLGGKGVKSQSIDLNGSGTYVDGTVVKISGCTNKYQCINDESESTVLQWQDLADLETYNLDNLSTITTASKITVCVDASSPTGPSSMQIVLRIDGTDYYSANIAASQSVYTTYCNDFVGSWSNIFVNAAEAGVYLAVDGGALNVSEINVTVYGYE